MQMEPVSQTLCFVFWLHSQADVTFDHSLR
jgi:hypothetical protein